MMQSSPLPLSPRLWRDLPTVLPIRRRRLVGAAAVLLVTLLAASLAAGIASPRFSGNGGGSIGVMTDPSGQVISTSYDFAYLANASLRPWTLEAVRVGGDTTVASRIDRGHPAGDRPEPPVGHSTPLTIGVGERFTVVAASAAAPPCLNGSRVTPRAEIEVLVSGLFGDRWIHVGTTSGSRTGCQAS